MNKKLLFIALAACVAAVAATEMYLDNCDKTNQNQQFVFDNDHTIRSAGNSNNCINLDMGLATEHGHVFLYNSCSGDYNEKWTLEANGQISYDNKNDMCVGFLDHNQYTWPCLVSCKETTDKFVYDPKTKLISIAGTKFCLSYDTPAVKGCETIDSYPWCNYKLGVEARVDLLSKTLTPVEKISQLVTDAPALPQHGIEAYNWWSEAAHGVLTDAPVTSFPNSPGLSASRNLDLMKSVGSAISDEGRAIHNDKRVGLTFFAPNINIVRDPRWGRTMESYGEDPYLNGKFVTEFVKGMQEGEAQEYIKVVSTPKHYAAYSLEHWNNIDRTGYDAKVSDVDLLETYLPAFEAAVRDGGAASVMCSYNAVNGVPSCANKRLLQDFLRDRWGFKGYVVSDCDAVANVFDPHHYAKSPEEAAAMSLKAGTDLDCTSYYRQHLPAALAQGLVTEEDIDTAFRRLFWHRIRLGMFDPKEVCPYNKYDTSMIASEKNKAIALAAARESVVLLENHNNIVPLDATKIKSVALIGPNADDADVILGNYNGHPSRSDISTYKDGISKYTTVNYAKGALVDKVDKSMIDDAVAAAKKSDVVVLVVGLNNNVEAEGHDRVTPNMGTDMSLPGSQVDLVKAVQAVGKPTILVLVNGGAVTTEGLGDNISAVFECFYGGQAAGDAFAQILFGEASPSGRLPYTIYPTSWLEGTSFGDMDMHAGNGRTWKYTNKALYPFGYGKSYSTFSYSDAKVNHNTLSLSDDLDDATFELAITVTNTGSRDAAEVVQLMAQFPTDKKEDYMPAGKYVGFAKAFIPAGESRTLTVTVHTRDMATAVKIPAAPNGDTAKRTVLDGTYKVTVFGAELKVAATADITVTHKAGANDSTPEGLLGYLRNTVVV